MITRSVAELLSDCYDADLQALADVGRTRRCSVITSPRWPVCTVEGMPAVDFCSNNYLGLARDPRLIQASQEALEIFGTGSGASRLVSGTSDLIQALETEMAAFKQAEAALVFNSGYQANVGIFQALTGLEDWIFMDRLNHASLVDGVQFSKARWCRYHHLDLAHLESRLKKAPAQARKWVVTDTIFSMDGDGLNAEAPHANLFALIQLAEKHNAFVMVDEAHATGLFGPLRHSGLVEAYGLSDRVALQMGTFSKALGGFGAYVAGSKVLIDTLVNRCRSFIYSTALPPAVIAAARKAVEVVQGDPEPHNRLRQNVERFHDGLRPLLEERGLIGPSPAHPPGHIVPILLGERTMAVSSTLLERGYYVQGIRPPTVPEGSERLRITLSAAHTPKQIDGLLNAIAVVL